MKKTFAVLGLGRFGLNLIEELNRHHTDIIAIDASEENVIKASEIINNAFICDTTNEAGLRELGVNNVDHAIVAFGSNLQATILTTIILKELGIKKITVRVDNEYYVNVIRKLGATDIISPQKIAGIRLANKIVSDTFMDYYNIGGDFCIVEMVVNEEVGSRNIEEINPRNRFEINLLLIQREGRIFPPKATDDIRANDILYVFGTTSKISAFDHYLNVQILTQK